MTINEAMYGNPADVANALGAMGGIELKGLMPFALVNALNCIGRLQRQQAATFEALQALRGVVEDQANIIGRLQELLAVPEDRPDAFGNTEADVIYGDF